VPERNLVALGPRGTIECAVRANGSLEAKEFLDGAQCRRHLGAIYALFQTIVDQAADDEEIGPKPLKKTVIREFIKGQVRIFCYRDGTAWVLTHGDLKKSKSVFGNMRNLGNGESPDHDVDHGQMDNRLRCTCVEFIVLAHPPKPSQPCEGALHDPATRQKLESLGVVASLHDL